MNLFGLPFDHPAFPERVILTFETWLSFLWAGAGHGLYSVAYAAIFPPQRSMMDRAMSNFAAIAANAVGAWMAASPAIAHDYWLHYRCQPGPIRLFLLEVVRWIGFELVRALLLRRANIFFSPLLYLMSDPPALLHGAYVFLVLWVLWKVMPEVVVVSSSGFTIPKFVARYIGLFPEGYQKVKKEAMAEIVVKGGS